MEDLYKERQNKNLADALSISADRHVEGQAFDREWQAQRKQEKLDAAARLEKVRSGIALVDLLEAKLQ